MKELTPEQEQRIESRRNAKLPNTSCNLMSNHLLTCDDCRDMVSIDYQNRHYFCAKEFVTHRFKNAMKQNGKNIEIRWSNNYLIEKVDDDNMADGERSGIVLPPKIGQTGNTVVLDSEEAERSTGTTEDYPTEDKVGEVFNG